MSAERRASRTERSPSGAYVVVDSRGREHVRKTAGGRKARREPVVAPADICSVVYCDPDIIAASKAPGFPVVPSGPYHRRSVIMALAELGFGELFPVNHLDREATGLVIFSRNDVAAKALRWNWRSNLCERQFLVVVNGDITGARGRITLPIGSQGAGAGGRQRGVVSLEEGGRPATTKWKLIARGRGMSRLLVTLGRGRCHQIRIHLASIGHPVVGDTVYLDRSTDVPLSALVDMPDRMKDAKKLPSHQIGLHSMRILMPHPMTNQAMDLQAPPPRILMDLMPGAWVVDAS